MKKDYLSIILRLDQTVFTFKELSLIWGETNANYAKKIVHNYIKAGKLYPLRRGIYAKDENYSRFELATKIYTPSYISYETVLAKAGIIFQRYSQIFVASYLSREITINNQTYVFRKQKNAILTSQLGLDKKENYFIASKERAFLDTLYLNKNYHFDNLAPIDWEFCRQLVSVYSNKALHQRLNSYYQSFKNA